MVGEEARKMSPSPALANPSFLYGGAGGPANRRGDGIVYATLDSLALTGTTLPLAVLRQPGDEEQPARIAKVKPAVAPKPILNAATKAYSPAKRPTTLDINVTTAPSNGSFLYAKHAPTVQQAFDSESDNNYSISSSGSAASSEPRKPPEPKKEHREFGFAKNVLHYVPMSRRYARKPRKLPSKSHSLKSLAQAVDRASRGLDDSWRSLRCRSLSRDELKYITISQPSNFVHVASATRSSLVESDQPSPDEQQPGHRRIIKRECKYADLKHSGYVDVVLGKEVESGVNVNFVVNDSELWRRLSKHHGAELEEEGEKKGLEQELREELHEERVERGLVDNDDYDDVGPPVVSPSSQSFLETQEERLTEDEDTYDDVGPPTVCVNSPKSTPASPEPKVSKVYEDDEVYDDVGPPIDTNIATEEEVQLRVNFSTEIDDPDEDVYDDVGPPPATQNNHEYHERVNSLYAGSSASGSIQLALNAHDKESEWEDLDDAAIYGINNGSKHVVNESGHSISPSKKKLSGQRWSRKVRRQRSRASRKSSGRSTSRTRSLAAVHGDARRYSVAVSLGTGSILLLGATKEQPATLPEPKEERSEPYVAKGLVQLRLILQDDVQEASLYVAEDSSDDSNYETLEIYEPDDFSTESESESTPGERGSGPHVDPSTTAQEPPNRPVPPPPREASLGHTLVRPMKMLRRTWSITKGSLGRMRRRASGECEPAETHGGAGDSKKYFSFKKHFRKNLASTHSTFYLDKTVNAEKDAEAVNDRAEEPIYSNCNWYREAGLYVIQPKEGPKSEQQSIDHYSVLAEEPLYQFYTINATKTAFESDSDGYEEVEELTPSSATTDLARPGHRTLWCQTPQVINSGLLQKLSMEERKVQEAKFEILTSEASYLNSLRVLENEFASNQELVHEVLTSIEREKLFAAVPDVLVASERFLAELEAIWREDPMLTRLPELLMKHGDKSCSVYVDYCSHQVNIDATLKELRAKKGYKFLDTVSRIESRPACQSLSLHSFLMLPMQRITRLPLLADAVLSKLSVEHEERLSWESVLKSLSHIAAKCNEGARLAERRNEMEALARKLEYSVKVPPIDLHERELIRSGTVVHLSMKSDTEYKLTFGKKFHKTPLMLMLLTDYLLVTKLKSNSNEETFTVMETCKRSLVSLVAAPEDSPFAGRHAMVLTLLENHAGRQIEYLLTCESDTERERWLEAISPPKPTCVGETLYESWDCPQVMAVFSYAPLQPDEIQLQPGDVINVLRKMNDGWLFGEKLLDGEQGWFPGNFTKEVASEHVRARNLRQRHRFLALSGSVLQRKAKQSLSLL